MKRITWNQKVTSSSAAKRGTAEDNATGRDSKGEVRISEDQIRKG